MPVEKDDSPTSSVSRPDLKYIPYNDLFAGEAPIDMNFGDPAEAWGIEPHHLEVDTRIYYKRKEVPIGEVHTLTGDSMDLTADLEFSALRLIYKREDLGLGNNVVIYILTQDAPFGWDQAPIEEVEPNWSADIEHVEGSMAEVLQQPGARKLSVNVDDIIRARGGDPARRTSKSEQGGWGSNHERNRRTTS